MAEDLSKRAWKAPVGALAAREHGDLRLESFGERRFVNSGELLAIR